jgi:DNA invertase Pin-like site-specific DNA recombinase
LIEKRCAIYTRTSTDEGLSQSFNSLDAQREACQAYVASQRHEGWSLNRQAYDDGGHSGGSMERPALKNLLADIRSRLIDIIVVYKIDRLTRSLADFAKMVELFDQTGVSFVSVTQQFNTSTSMGRLTLNMLLSFAQFEREVTAERIRDKIAASRRKGMWMGGPPPLGYDVRDKRLVINQHEAQTVTQIFQMYLKLRTTGALTTWAAAEGIITKQRMGGDGRLRSGGRPFSRGNLHALLSNHTYVGEVKHKGMIYQGQHEAIIPRDLWDEVQQALIAKASLPRSSVYSRQTCWLKGLLFDETGERLTPTHATKNGRRYRYYVSQRLTAGNAKFDSGWRLPARQLESAIDNGIAAFFRDRLRLTQALKLDTLPADRLARTLTTAAAIATTMGKTSDANSDALSLVRRATLNPTSIQIELSAPALLAGLELSNIDPLVELTHGQDSILLTVPFAIRRRGVETKIVLEANPHDRPQRDEHLVRMVARSYKWMRQLTLGEAVLLKDLAASEGLDPAEVTRLLPLACLSPDIVETILAGRQPLELTVERLKRLRDLPLDWSKQHIFLGFDLDNR